MDRRVFFAELTRLAALAAIVPNDWRVTKRPKLVDDPFLLGVASGDPTPTGAIIWTRLAPRPLEPGAGMVGQRTVVTWELAEDDGFTRIVKAGRATAVPELAHSIHVDVDGLTPGRWYLYRFRTGDAVSPVGRLRTTPASDAEAPLAFAFVSCQHYEQGLFTAYQHLAQEELDLVAHLGDYIYEYGVIEGRPRRHSVRECLTLDDYRERYAQYKTDAHLQAAHARCPWLVTWDDHEVDNNYANLVGENALESEEQMHQRRAAAYQAWWEHQPVRVSRARSWADLNITRTLTWGALAHFWVLDTRQYRSPHGCHGASGAHIAPCADWLDPRRTLLGNEQEKWLLGGLGATRTRWEVLANQVMMAPNDNTPGPEQRFSMDTWNGYPAAREKLLNAVATRAPNRTVVLTGDIHSNWVSELKSSFLKPQAPTVAAELVGTSISSGGDGADTYVRAEVIAENPHIKWHNGRRGYVSCRVSPDEWRAAYRIVPFVTRPDAPIETASNWVMHRGRPGIERA